MIDVVAFGKELTLLENKRSLLRQELAGNKLQLEEQRIEQSLLAKTHAALESIEEALRGGFIAYIEELVSYGISLVFSKKREFKIYYRTRASVPVVDFKIVSDYGESDIYEAQGGGVVNVVSFLLRLILLVHSNPPLARIMFLDESFRHVSPEYVPAVAQLMKELCARMEMSFVMISHQPAFLDYADRIYELDQRDGVTQISLTKKHKHEVEGM